MYTISANESAKIITIVELCISENLIFTHHVLVLIFFRIFVDMKMLCKIFATMRAFGWILLLLLYIVIAGAPHVFAHFIPKGWKWGTA
jgi:hypothetical protein